MSMSSVLSGSTPPSAPPAPINLLVVGVGGQGILTLSALVVSAAMEAGFDIKQSEVHGMAQRGGSVMSHVRMGRKIFSPVIEPGTADMIVALEKLEALRHIHYLAPQGVLIVEDRVIPPLPVSTGEMAYPPDVLEQCRARAGRVEVYDGAALALALGTERTLNTCFAGVLSRHLPFDEAAWRKGLEACFSARNLEANVRAFQHGRSVLPL
ncbi:MAG: indolepyruvate oxidoreductase subunit beta [Candidatus Sumerlaeia bacterium]|nr:indolepyruvate oxidoreductase subunit beta [Candidatus Sumerlaeia bacterium]